MASSGTNPLKTFCRKTIPTMTAAADGQRTLRDVGQLMDTERWNSFDRFHDTTSALTSLYDAGGVANEVYAIQTGGAMNTGRWTITEAADIGSATMDVVAPVRHRVLDYRENPWHVVQWSASTRRGGVTGKLVVIDTIKELEAVRPGSLTGAMILTRVDLYGRIAAFARTGAVGVVVDRPVPNLPNATKWAKFSWGGLASQDALYRMVGLVLSEKAGDHLRGLIAAHGPLTVRTRVDIRHYVGSQDLISGIVPGAADPDSEVWAISHSAEPGAIDNSSGVAVCVEIARMLEDLIRREKLPRPRRTIRVLSGYECYSFFHYLEHGRRRQTPLAGICIDSVGSRPRVCNGRIHLHGTIASSAGFVDRVGAAIIRATLGLNNPGYTLHEQPFVSTCDTLIGDPKYGFPCPWFTTHFQSKKQAFDAYHSSGDTLDLLSAEGLAMAAASMAGYLYYLADAGNPELLEMARTETRRTVRKLAALAKRKTPPDAAAKATFLREQHHTSMDRLARWSWGGDRSSILRALSGHEETVGVAATFAKPRRRAAAGRRVPRRTAVLTPQLQNTPEPIAKVIRESKLADWTLMWADGRRTIAEITDAARCDLGTDVTVKQVDAFFDAHRELGYVEIAEPKDMISKTAIVADLKRLGVRSGMDVICHSSLSAIGHVIGGADAVIDAICSVIGKRGVLMAPSFNFGDVSVFNPATTPAMTGAIPQAMLKRPDAVRSDNPTHPLVALGRRADELCRDHAAAGVWSDDSPIGRLIHTGGYILSLGVSQVYSTAYHVAEVSMSCTSIDQFATHVNAVGADGEVRPVPSLAYRETFCPMPANALGKILDRKKLRRHGKVGQADCTLVKAMDLYNARRDQVKPACPTCTVKPEKV